MKRRFTILAILVCIAAPALVGCSSVMLTTQTATAAPPESAMVTFVRTSIIFAGEKSHLWVDGHLIGELKGKQMAQFTVPPGRHLFVGTNTTSGMSFLEADLAAGRHYVVDVHVFPAGVGEAGLALDPLIPGASPDVTKETIDGLLADLGAKVMDETKKAEFLAEYQPKLDAAVAAHAAGSVEVKTLGPNDSW